MRATLPATRGMLFRLEEEPSSHHHRNAPSTSPHVEKDKMQTDCFVLGSPVPITDGMMEQDNQTEYWNSQESFVTPSVDENFGDWGSFTKRTLDAEARVGSHEIEVDFSDDVEEAEDNNEGIQNEGNNNSSNGGFLLTPRNGFPKLAVSRREVRKVSMYDQKQPTIVIEKGDFSEEKDILVSPMTPMDFATPSRRKVTRSFSDCGSGFSFRKKKPESGEKNTPMSAGPRSLWKTQKGTEMSMSFTTRGSYNSNKNPSRQESFRNLRREDEENYDDVFEDENDSEPGEDPAVFSSDFVEDAEVALKSSPKTSGSKKRSNSKDRVFRRGSSKANINEESGHRHPNRKGSFGKRGKSADSGDGRGKSVDSRGGKPHSSRRRMSLSDSIQRSTHRDKSLDRDSFTSSTDGVSKSSSEHENQSSDQKGSRSGRRRRSRSARRNNLEKEILEAASLRRTSTRRGSMGDDQPVITSHKSRSKSRSKSRTRSKSRSVSRGKYASRNNGRRSAVRRTSMTGDIIDSTPDRPKERKRHSMDHRYSTSKSPGDHRERRRSTGFSKSPAGNALDKSSRRRDSIKSLSKEDVSARIIPIHIPNQEKEESNPFPSPPFVDDDVESFHGDNGTESYRMMNRSTYTNPTKVQKEYEFSTSQPISRAASIHASSETSRDIIPPRRRKSTGRMQKRISGNRSSERPRSEKKQKPRSSLTSSHHKPHSQPQMGEKKTVTVEDILAFVKNTPSPPSEYETSKSNAKRRYSGDGVKALSSRSGRGSFSKSDKFASEPFTVSNSSGDPDRSTSFHESLEHTPDERSGSFCPRERERSRSRSLSRGDPRDQSRSRSRRLKLRKKKEGEQREPRRHSRSRRRASFR